MLQIFRKLSRLFRFQILFGLSYLEITFQISYTDKDRHNWALSSLFLLSLMKVSRIYYPASGFPTSKPSAPLFTRHWTYSPLQKPFFSRNGRMQKFLFVFKNVLLSCYSRAGGPRQFVCVHVHAHTHTHTHTQSTIITNPTPHHKHRTICFLAT